MTERSLVLWDIDGTLVHAAGTGILAYRRAFAALTGCPPPEEGFALPGTTDLQGVLEELAQSGLDADLARPILGRTAKEFDALADDLVTKGRALPGAAVVLQRLAEDATCVQSVLTGNIEPIARRKLAAFGLAEHLDLDVGAYGDAHGSRADLLLVAWENQRRLRGRSFAPERTWVVGDTPRDLACAQAHRARCLLVATGQYSLSDLSSLDADAVVPDLLAAETILQVRA